MHSAHQHNGISAHRFVSSVGRVFLFSIVLIGETSCGSGMIHEYLNADNSIYTDAPVYVDSSGYAEITVQVNGKFPTLTVYYGCEEYNIRKLYSLKAELIVDGKVVECERGFMNASYANTSVTCPLNLSGDSINKRLGIDSTQYMDSFSVGLMLSQDYPDLTELPGQLSVHFTSEAEGGNTDTTIVLTLRSSKDTRAPFRVH